MVVVMVDHVVVLGTTWFGRMMLGGHERGLCIGLGATKCVSFRNGDPAFVSRLAFFLYKFTVFGVRGRHCVL